MRFLTEDMGMITTDNLPTDGCHYNYKRQEWVDGHDHAHIFPVGHVNMTNAVDGMVFCGADLRTCFGVVVEETYV